MTSRELRLWAELYRVEPWGDERGDGRADTIANVLVGLQTPKGKQHKWKRYTPDYGRALRPPQTEDEMKRTLRNMAAMCGAARGK